MYINTNTASKNIDADHQIGADLIVKESLFNIKVS